MMLSPLICSILKVSVTTRWPLMNMPKEPESTAWLAAGLGLSFLSEPKACGAATLGAARDEASRSVVAQRVTVSNFTQRLLLLRGRRFSSVSAQLRFHLRWRRWSGRRFRFSTTRADNVSAAPGADREIVFRFAAGDGWRLSRASVLNSVATTRRPARPGRRLRRSRLSAEQHSPVARKPLPRERQCEPIRLPVLSISPAETRARRDEKLFLPSHEKFPRPCALRRVRCDRRDLQRANSAVSQGRGLRWFFRRP